MRHRIIASLALSCSLVACTQYYGGTPLTTVMETQCSRFSSDFSSFHKCTNQNWYFPVVAEGMGNVDAVRLFQSRMELLEAAVSSGTMANQQAVADAKYLAYQLRAEEYAAVRQQNYRIMQGLSMAAGQPAATPGGRTPAGYNLCNYKAGNIVWTETYMGACPASSRKSGYIGYLNR